MGKFRVLLSVLTIFSISLFIICFANNITFRASEVYSYYFNETRVLDSIHTTLSVNEMADAFTEYLNSYGNDNFSVQEETGYDMEDIFTNAEGINMLKVKKALRIMAIGAIITFAYTFIVYFLITRDNDPAVLRLCYKISMPVSLALIYLEFRTCNSTAGVDRLMKILRFNELSQDCGLSLILDESFLAFGSIIFVLIALACFVAVTVIAFRSTRTNNLFYRGK